MEFDRTTSWKVAAYVRDLLEGNDRGRSIVAEKIWEGRSSFQVPAAEEQSNARTEDQQPAPLIVFRQAVWQTYLLLHDLVELKGLASGSAEVNSVIDRLVTAWPTNDQPPSILAEIIVDGVHTRELHAATIADRLKELLKFDAVVLEIDKILAERMLCRISGRNDLWVPVLERIDLLHRAGRTIAGWSKPTHFIRNHANPILNGYITEIETGHVRTAGHRWDPAIASFCLIIIGLEVALSASGVQIEHKAALGREYIYLLGRLFRSWISEELYGHSEDPGFGKNLAREALDQALRLNVKLDFDLDAAFERLKADPLIPDALKTLLAVEIS